MNTLLHYKVYGERTNPCLLIIHGLFGSLDNWMSLAKKWSNHSCVIAIDVRNHGKSFHSDTMTFEEMNRDISAILEVEKIYKINLLGHSMGGKIAMEYAGEHPERLLKLIVVDVAPYAYPVHHSEVFHMLDNLFPAHFESRLEIENELRNYLKQESVVQFMSKNIRRNEETNHFEWKFNLPVLKNNYEYLIARVPEKGFLGSTLFIGGEQSSYISKETSGLIFDFYPNFELEYVSHAGHWVHADNPVEFYEKTNRFLNKQ